MCTHCGIWPLKFLVWECTLGSKHWACSGVLIPTSDFSCLSQMSLKVQHCSSQELLISLALLLHFVKPCTAPSNLWVTCTAGACKAQYLIPAQTKGAVDWDILCLCFSGGSRDTKKCGFLTPGNAETVYIYIYPQTCFMCIYTYIYRSID